MDKFKISITNKKTLIKIEYPDVQVVSIYKYEEPRARKVYNVVHMLTIDEAHYTHEVTEDDEIRIIP